MKLVYTALVLSLMFNVFLIKECYHKPQSVQCVAHLIDQNNTKVDIETECQI